MSILQRVPCLSHVPYHSKECSSEFYSSIRLQGHVHGYQSLQNRKKKLKHVHKQPAATEDYNKNKLTNVYEHMVKVPVHTLSQLKILDTLL